MECSPLGKVKGPLGRGNFPQMPPLFLRWRWQAFTLLTRLRRFLRGNAPVEKLAILDTHILIGSWFNFADLSFAGFPTLHSEPCPLKVPAAS
jgi:hypothetical protein